MHDCPITLHHKKYTRSQPKVRRLLVFNDVVAYCGIKSHAVKAHAVHTYPVVVTVVANDKLHLTISPVAGEYIARAVRGLLKCMFKRGSDICENSRPFESLIHAFLERAPTHTHLRLHAHHPTTTTTNKTTGSKVQKIIN